MPKVKVRCKNCQKVFQRVLSEVNRNKKKNREIFCSISCNAKYTFNKKIPVEKRLPSPFLKGNAFSSNRKDKFSPFRFHLKNVRKHANDKEVSITLEDIKNLWDKQNGKCPYTGWELENSISIRKVPKLSPRRASIDRIDNSKGYTKDNIQFVAYMYNICKNKFTDEDVQIFAKSIVNN